jgi:hypothetical protein
VVTRRTIRIKLGPISGAELRKQQRLEREEIARRDACPSHLFLRVAGEPPRWYCLKCNSGAGLDYVRGFVSGLIASDEDPAVFIADYGTWP